MAIKNYKAKLIAFFYKINIKKWKNVIKIFFRGEKIIKYYI